MPDVAVHLHISVDCKHIPCEFRRIHFSYNGGRAVFGVGVVSAELLTDMLCKLFREEITAHCFCLFVDNTEIFQPDLVTRQELVIGHVLV